MISASECRKVGTEVCARPNNESICIVLRTRSAIICTNRSDSPSRSIREMSLPRKSHLASQLGVTGEFTVHLTITTVARRRAVHDSHALASMATNERVIQFPLPSKGYPVEAVARNDAISEDS